jgi:hypothetical protein
VAVGSAKTNAKRLREQDGGTLDLRRQSLRQHGLLHDKHSVGPHSPPVGGITVPTVAAPPEVSHDDAVKAEIQRQKEELKMKEAEMQSKIDKERFSLWNWIRGKKVEESIADLTQPKGP